MDTSIYLDNNATTPLGTHARQAMMEGMSDG
jgi:cysteine sulfinate desulfinase/cysteine desulfurase-like protein